MARIFCKTWKLCKISSYAGWTRSSLHKGPCSRTESPPLNLTVASWRFWISAGIPAIQSEAFPRQTHDGTVRQIRPRPRPSRYFIIHYSRILSLDAAGAVTWLRHLSAGLSQRSSAFDFLQVLVGYGVNRVAQGQVSLQLRQCFPVRIIPLILRTHGCLICYHC